MATAEKAKVTGAILDELGFATVTVETEVGGVKYPLTYHTSKGNLDVWRKYAEFIGVPFDEFCAGALDEVQTQRATQGNKGPVRDAKAETDEAGNVVTSLEDVRAKAIAKHQEKALNFALGKPRERSVGGITADAKKKLGAAVVEAAIAKGGVMPTQAEMDEIAKSLGIDPAMLAANA